MKQIHYIHFTESGYAIGMQIINNKQVTNDFLYKFNKKGVVEYTPYIDMAKIFSDTDEAIEVLEFLSK